MSGHLHEYDYIRKKIFTEEAGNSPMWRFPRQGQMGYSQHQARTIRPDGSIVNFDGKVYEKEIVKARGSIPCQTFTPPMFSRAVIIEYHYMIDLRIPALRFKTGPE